MSPEIKVGNQWEKTANGWLCTHSTTDASIAKKPHGFYSKIEIHNSDIVATVDHIRSIPIFYSVSDDNFYISDNSDWIEKQIATRRSTIADGEYELAGYVSGRDTRHPNIKKLLPGERLHWKDGELEIDQHFDLGYDHSGRKSVVHVENAAETAVERLIDYADSRQIVLPLSGGLDSRIIAALLVKQGYDNLTSFTYGRPEANEVQIAKKRAAALGIDWKHVKYNHETWRKWYRGRHRQRLFEANANLAAIPHIEMGPALAKLRNQPNIDPDAIIVPGHTGDMLSGGHIPRSLYEADDVKDEEVVKAVLDKHYRLSEITADQRSKLEQRIIDHLELPQRMDSKTACESVEIFDYRNRQAGFIVNSLRAVETSGFDWYLPLWDRDFAEFWFTVPLKQRVGRRLYRDTVGEIWSDVTGESTKTATETERSTPLNKIKAMVRKSPAEPVFRKAYERVHSSRAYGSHPLAWYGIMPERVFDQIYTGSEHLNTFLAKEQLGEISLSSNQC